MKVNDNFVIRIIKDAIVIFPIKNNPISNDPICINNTVYQILLNAPESDNSSELCQSIVRLFSLDKEDDIKQIEECITQLIALDLICEVDIVE